MNDILNHYITLPFLEIIAVITSLVYVILAAKKNIWCWPAAFISTVIYTFLFYKFYLWMDSLLQVYYMGMAFYGWYCWNKNIENPDTSNVQINNIQLKTYGVKTHIISILLLSIVSLVIGYIMDKYTPTDFPYLDSATTVFAVFSTVLVAQKVVENWLYWIVIDAVSIYLYVEKGLTPTAFLFGVFILIAAYGYYMWRKEYLGYNFSPSELKLT